MSNQNFKVIFLIQKLFFVLPSWHSFGGVYNIQGIQKILAVFLARNTTRKSISNKHKIKWCITKLFESFFFHFVGITCQTRDESLPHVFTDVRHIDCSLASFDVLTILTMGSIALVNLTMTMLLSTGEEWSSAEAVVWRTSWVPLPVGHQPPNYRILYSIS